MLTKPTVTNTNYEAGTGSNENEAKLDAMRKLRRDYK